ncbi:MAG TPA: hypothetical protein VHC22_02445 [Pirellulales bacterium]|nr:hypothetical protein [Pirellulales bacterium]
MSRRCRLPRCAVACVAWYLAAAAGCSLHHCDYEPGEAVGLRVACDPYAAKVYRRHPCRIPGRDPRIPGPRIVTTLPAAPEAAGPGYFNPVPTYPVFGPRSEEPDGLEPDMQQLDPDDGTIEGEMLPPPAMSAERPASDDEEEESDEDESGGLRLAAPQQSMRQAGWRPARRQAAEPETATRPCATCTVRFRQRTTTAQ